MFKESLLPLSGGAWLALTLDASPEHEPPTRDTELAYASLHSGDGLPRDMLALISLPIPADEKAAKERDRTTAGQREMVERAKGTKSEAQYRDNVLRYAAEAESLRKPTGLMPRWVFPLDGMRVLCGFHVHRHPVFFRLVDLGKAAEVCAFDGIAIHAQIAGSLTRAPQSLNPEREIRRLTEGLDYDSLSDDEAEELTRRIESLAAIQQEFDRERVTPLKLRPLAATENRLLLDMGMERVLVGYEGATFRLVARWPCQFGGWPVSARTTEGFVFHRISGEDERDEVMNVSAQDGAELDIWPSKGRRVLSKAASGSPPGDTLALAALGGPVVVQHCGESACMHIPKLLTVDKYDSLDIDLSPNGRIVAMCRAFDGRTLALYDCARGLAASTPFPAMEVDQTGVSCQTRAPGFAITDDCLLLLTAGQLNITALDALDWQPPIKPAPPIKRRRTPALTLEGALEHGPVAEIADLVRSWFRPGVILTPKRKHGARLPIASSKSGGQPDLSMGSTWPRYRGTPMAFLVQINLGESAAVEPSMGLPLEGLLSVFLAFDDCPMPSFYSDANSDADGCRVIYTPAGATLERMPLPDDMPTEHYEGKDVICGYSIRVGGAMLPELSNDRVQRANLTPQQNQAYRELVRAVNGDDDAPATWATRLGGYPARLQNDDLHLQAETYATGLPLCDSTYATWSDRSFQQSAQVWRQLLQLNEGNEGWSWGDAGLMHIIVRDDQWYTGSFSPAWGIGVCH